MRHLKLFIGLFLILISCNKDDGPNFINQISDETVKYVINLSNLKIIDYSKYINNELIETTSFQNTDSTIVKFTRNSKNEITNKSIFLLGNNSLAKSCIDSSFNEYGLYTARLEYEYENDFLSETTINWNRFGDNADSGQVYMTRIIENENIISSNFAVEDWTSGCTDYFSYNSTFNKIDVKDFSNGITGKISKNLIEHASWNNGCPCGPSSSVAYSDYKYEIDANGFLTKRIETYTPCYHLSFSDEVTRTISTILYEYNAR